MKCRHLFYLKKNPFQSHDLLVRVDPEGLKLGVSGQLTNGPDDVSTFLRSFFAFASQEQATSCDRLKLKKRVIEQI
jgi:hypothetical protein